MYVQECKKERKTDHQSVEAERAKWSISGVDGRGPPSLAHDELGGAVMSGSSASSRREAGVQRGEGGATLGPTHGSK